MAEGWSSIRVRERTLRRLNAEIQHLLRCYTEGTIDLPNGAEGYSHDALVNRLLDQLHGHRRRGRAQRARGYKRPKRRR